MKTPADGSRRPRRDGTPPRAPAGSGRRAGHQPAGHEQQAQWHYALSANEIHIIAGTLGCHPERLTP